MCFGIRFYKSCGCPGLSLPACPLVGMTPPPVKGARDFPYKLPPWGHKGYACLSLLCKQGKPGQVYYSQQIGKIQIPYFAPPAASRISTKTLCPASIRPDPLRPDSKINKKKKRSSVLLLPSIVRFSDIRPIFIYCIL